MDKHNLEKDIASDLKEQFETESTARPVPPRKAPKDPRFRSGMAPRGIVWSAATSRATCIPEM